MAKTETLKIHRVTAFVDWDTARRVVPHNVRRGREGFEGRAIELLQNALSNVLTEKFGKRIFRVQFRLYHGWYSGKTKSRDRNLIESLEQTGTQRSIGTVSFMSEFGYSDQLLCGGPRCRLHDTLRRREGIDGQKMVDTALVSDLLHFVRCHYGDIAVVVGDDDDLLPGVLTADSWGGCEVFVLRLRTDDNRFLNTHGLIHHIRSGL